MKHWMLATMAWRNLWKNRRRTLITLSSFAFGTMLAVIFTGMGDASYHQMIDLAASMGGGHVTIQHADYLERPSLKRRVRGDDDLFREMRQYSEVTGVVSRISGTAMLATAGHNYGALFLAIDPAQESDATLSISKDLHEGEMLSTSDGDGIVLGAILAENLDVKIGRKVIYTMTDIHGEIVTGLARVRGIIKTGAPSVDGGLCLFPIDAIRAVLGYEENAATQIALMLDDERKSDEIARKISTQLSLIPHQSPDESPVALAWHQTQPDLAGFIALDRAGNVVFQLIIMVLIAAGIFNSLFVSVMERMREFGIMLALGFSPKNLAALVLWESFWIAIVGLFTTALVTVAPYYYLNVYGIDFSAMLGEGYEVSGIAMESVLYSDIYAVSLLRIAIVVVLATMVSGLYPAWKAARMVPIDSIKLV